MADLHTKIGLEIHVQLKTKSKMFCRCDNQSFAEATDGKQRPVEPNTLVCPVCLGLPGALPVANKQAIEWTIKTGLALNCEIGKISKFDRKHYFYPDLPKGYQISQYDEPFCLGGFVEIDGAKIRLNRIHLEEDAGKLIHRGGESLVDLNRAGTPLMEIVTEPDIISPKQAGDFLRKLQKIVRDVVEVSEASMEKGHLRCDANISISQNDRMSPIIEIKNINSFKFVEKALSLVEEKLKNKFEEWPEKKSKETWGYNSVDNKVFLQRRKEEASDYRYFPEPDLPPFDTSLLDLEKLGSVQKNEEEKVSYLEGIGMSLADAKVLANDSTKYLLFIELEKNLSSDIEKSLAGKALVHNYFGAPLKNFDEKAPLVASAIKDLTAEKFSRNIFLAIVKNIMGSEKSYKTIFAEAMEGRIDGEDKLSEIIVNILAKNPIEVDRYKMGEKQLVGFFMGMAMKETGGKANPAQIMKILTEKLKG